MKYIITLLGLIVSINANATLLTINFDDTQYAVGDTVTGELVVSNFSETLGGFFAEIVFDEQLLSLTSFSLGNGFDDGLGSYSFTDDSVAGLLSIEDYADLAADISILGLNQGSSFVLANFTFRTLSSGLQTVSILAGAEVISFNNSTVTVLPSTDTSFNVTQVPEPTTGLLLIAGLAGILRKAK